MSARERRKGAAAERELFGLLRDDLGVVVQRNLSQSRGGGADCITIPGYSIEVKRQERLALSAWWTQTVAQAGDNTPILFFRQSRQPWRAVIDLHHVAPEVFQPNDLAVVGYDVAVKFIRAGLAGPSSRQPTRVMRAAFAR